MALTATFSFTCTRAGQVYMSRDYYAYNASNTNVGNCIMTRVVNGIALTSTQATLSNPLTINVGDTITITYATTNANAVYLNNGNAGNPIIGTVSPTNPSNSQRPVDGALVQCTNINNNDLSVFLNNGNANFSYFFYRFNGQAYGTYSTWTNTNLPWAGCIESFTNGVTFNLPSTITTVGNSFFSMFNSLGALTSLPSGSFNTSNITAISDSFFYSFNYYGALTSLPAGSFNTSNITTTGNSFFQAFNSHGLLTSLPEGSFDTSNITTVGDNFFYQFNNNGALTSLPSGSFNTSNITTVGNNFFIYFNNNGALREGTDVMIKNVTSGNVTFYGRRWANTNTSTAVTAGNSFGYSSTPALPFYVHIDGNRATAMTFSGVPMPT